MDQANDWLRAIGIDSGSVFGNILVTLAAFIVATWLGGRLRERTIAALSKRSFARNDAILLGRLASMVAYLIATIVTLVAWGVNSTGILTAVGAFSVALGLSLQDVFRNFFSGVLLLLEKPFKVGDYVKVQDVEGEVLGIDIRTTMVRTLNGATVMIPNSILYSQIMTTRSKRGARRLDLLVTGKDVEASALLRMVEVGVRQTGLARPPISSPSIVSTSGESTVVGISVLLPEAGGTREQVVNSIMEQRGSIALEVKVL